VALSRTSSTLSRFAALTAGILQDLPPDKESALGKRAPAATRQHQQLNHLFG
jgi:hypothetical protein